MPEANLTSVGWALTSLSVLPLVIVQLALGWPRTRAWLRQDVGDSLGLQLGRVSLPVACYILAGLAMGRFNPYATAVVVAGIIVVIGTLSQVRQGCPQVTWNDAAVWLILWIPFDFRWTSEIWYGLDDLAYSWWAIGITVVAVYGYGVIRDLPGLGYCLIPRWRDLPITLLALGGLASIAIPVGLASGLLRFPPTTLMTVSAVLLRLVVLFLTVALPEELCFRGILQNGLNRLLQNPRLAVLLASLAFGLMHWNNRGDLTMQLVYTGLATIAGLFYGWAYFRSGGLLAPILCHTLVDLIWHFGFH